VPKAKSVIARARAKAANTSDPSSGEAAEKSESDQQSETEVPKMEDAKSDVEEDTSAKINPEVKTTEAADATVDADSDDVELSCDLEALAVAKQKLQAAAAAEAADREKKRAEDAAAKERKKSEEALKKAEEAAARDRRMKEEADRIIKREAQRRAAEEAAGRERARRASERLREEQDKVQRDNEAELKRRIAQRAALNERELREAITRKRDADKAMREAVDKVSEMAKKFKQSPAKAKSKAPPSKQRSDSAESGSDSEDSLSSTERERRIAMRKVDWSNAPPELLPRDQVATPQAPVGAFVEHFVRYTIGAWRRELDKAIPFDGMGLKDMDLQVFGDRQALQNVENGVSVLILQLAKKQANETIVKGLDKIVTLAAEREYQEAHTAYIEMALGNKRWNNTVSTYAGTVCQNKGGRTYLTVMDKLRDFDKDPVAQKYSQCLRKLVQLAQCVRPNKEISKHALI